MIKRCLVVFMLLALALSGCKMGGEPEKSEIEKRRGQREAEWQERLAKKEVATDAGISFGPEAGSEEIRKELSVISRELKIAVLGPETGELSEFGIKTLEGALLAAENINNSGGILGKKLEIVHYDSESSTKGASIATAKIIEQNVIAIIGSPTGEITFSATQMANNSHTIFISAGTRRRLGDSGPYIFRNALPDDLAIKRLMNYVIKETGAKEFALITSMSNDYSLQLSSMFKKEIIDVGANLVADVTLWAENVANIGAEESSIESQVKKIKTRKPEAIIYTGEAEEGAQILIEAKKQGLSVPMIGCEDLHLPDFLKLGKSAVVGTVFYSSYAPEWENELNHKFTKDYRKKQGKDPDKLVAMGYDSLNIIARAITDTGSTETGKVRDSMRNIKDFSGVAGVLSFDESREPVRSPFIYRVVKDGSSGARFSLVSP